MSARIIQGNALALPLADNTVDLVVTSPPYFGLRSYQDGGEHYAGQIGAEATPAEFVDALIAATREMVRVVKPSGSIWVNLGDKYTGGGGYAPNAPSNVGNNRHGDGHGGARSASNGGKSWGFRHKSLLGIPWRYALRCIDDLGLILRAEVIWSKPNGMPESVTDRVRRSHEQWFHFTLEPRYYSAVDEIREPHVQPDRVRADVFGGKSAALGVRHAGPTVYTGPASQLGKLPGSVWTVATEPLRVPEALGVDHFAAFPTEWPRRIIQGWSPIGICTVCGQGRRPIKSTEVDTTRTPARRNTYTPGMTANGNGNNGTSSSTWGQWTVTSIVGYECDCPDDSAPTRRATVLDPFGGTGTTALCADVLGRDAISVDMSADYCRLAQWRTTDPQQRAHAARVTPPPAVPEGQFDLFGDAA